ncbi:hypothetical protein CBNA_0365 [Coxiella burnetii str. Namibia]|nr:hypothetical protein CBNA_0365 [Coxiella burnetii str. Namibia]
MALSDDDCLKEEFNNFKDVINFLIESRDRSSYLR